MQVIPAHELMASFSGILPVVHSADSYHAFISYRWSKANDTVKFDSRFVEKLADAFSLHALGSHGERLRIFYDRKSLAVGREFDVDFKRALAVSLVVCPLVTTHALRAMRGPQDEVDNTLSEWWLALYLHDLEGSKAARKIVPIFAGEVGD